MNSTQINQAKFAEINGKVFQSCGMKFKVSQRFNDPETDPEIKKFYTKFNRTGHDGLDLVVYGEVKAIESGEVIYAGWDTDITWGTKRMFIGFGIMTVIWNKENNRFWLYAHLSENLSLEVGQIIQKGDFVGNMGGSGEGRQGKWNIHLHIGLYKVNGVPTILNRDNGFWGGIDPLPFLIDNQTETPQTQPKLQLSQVDSIQNVIQTPTKPVFSNPVYQNMYEQNRLDMVSDSLDDRADEIEKLKIENQDLRDQIAENQTNFRKDFNQFSKQQDKLNEKIVSFENNLETKQKSEFPTIPILQTQATFNQNPVLDNPIQAENKQKSEIPIILGANVLQNPQTIPSKYFWQSKKFLAVVSSILVGGIATYYKVDVTIVALGMSSFLGYLGIEGAIDIQKANQTTEFIKTFQQNANSQKTINSQK